MEHRRTTRTYAEMEQCDGEGLGFGHGNELQRVALTFGKELRHAQL